MAKTRKPRLGRGLSSLMSAPVAVQPPRESDGDTVDPSSGYDRNAGPDADRPSMVHGEVDPQESPPPAHHAAHDGSPLVYIPLDCLEPNPHQPRQEFDPQAIESLAQSIRSQGLMQPLVIRPLVPRDADNSPGTVPERAQIVAGERRWRAAREAGLDRVPAIVRDLTDRQLAEWALVENLQREDLDPIERAIAFRRLTDQFGMSHDEIATQVGIQRPTVSNHLRLLDLHDDLQQAVRRGQLSGGHARALLGLSDSEARLALGRRAIAGGWSVRMLEAAVKRAASAGADPAEPATSPSTRHQRPAHLSDLEDQIAAQLHTRVRLRSGRKKGSGSLTIEFYSLDEFDALLERLGVNLT